METRSDPCGISPENHSSPHGEKCVAFLRMPSIARAARCFVAYSWFLLSPSEARSSAGRHCVRPNPAYSDYSAESGNTHATRPPVHPSTRPSLAWRLTRNALHHTADP